MAAGHVTWQPGLNTLSGRDWQGVRVLNGGILVYTICLITAYAIQFLMELQTHHFWILKGRSTINSATEYEPDIFNTFCATRV